MGGNRQVSEPETCKATEVLPPKDLHDAAQERGEVQKHGGQVPRDVATHNIPTAADLGLRRDEIHEARKLRDAEAAEPGIVARGAGRGRRR